MVNEIKRRKKMIIPINQITQSGKEREKVYEDNYKF